MGTLNTARAFSRGLLASRVSRGRRPHARDRWDTPRTDLRAMLTDARRGGGGNLPGGHAVGQLLFFTGPSQVFYDGICVTHGQQGELVGPATIESHVGKGLAMLFPGNEDCIECSLALLSAGEPPPLPGGHKLGQMLFLTGSSQPFDDGDRTTHGQQGEVMPSHRSRSRGAEIRQIWLARSLVNSLRSSARSRSRTCPRIRPSRRKRRMGPRNHPPFATFFHRMAWARTPRGITFQSHPRLPKSQQGLCSSSAPPAASTGPNAQGCRAHLRETRPLRTRRSLTGICTSNET